MAPPLPYLILLSQSVTVTYNVTNRKLTNVTFFTPVNPKPTNPDPFIRQEPAEENPPQSGKHSWEQSPNMFQSDMILTPEQRDEIEAGIRLARDMGLDINKRKAISSTVYRWHRGRIPYRTDLTSGKCLQKLGTCSSNAVCDLVTPKSLYMDPWETHFLCKTIEEKRKSCL